MDQTVLVEQKQSEGERVVRALDDAGLPPSAAFWFYDADSDRWNLILAGSQFSASHGGPVDSYRKIAGVTSRLKPPTTSVSIADIKPVEEGDPLVTALRTMVHTGLEISSIRLTNNFVNGIYIADALVYRLQ
jgi:hypothetical protein